MHASKPPLSSAMIFTKVLAIVLCAAAFAAAKANAEPAPQAKTESADLSGFWSGGGMVIYSGGSREPARCRALFSQSGPDVAVQAQCATPSGSLEQGARLRQVGPEDYVGTFYNPQYNVAGGIQIAVRDKIQYVTLWSEAAAATLTLGRLPR
ncbi:MAG: hypothetical protein ACLP7P_04585 [Rhodomicrobium sp.]